MHPPFDVEPRTSWPDISLAALEATQRAFQALNGAPGYSPLYERVQRLLVDAAGLLREDLAS